LTRWTGLGGAAGRPALLPLLLALLGLLALSWGCAGRGPAPSGPTVTSDPLKLKPYKVNGVWYYPLTTAAGYRERGLASWYGSDFHGHSTASGEIYNMHGMTAAHKTLPLGTVVRVSQLETRRSVDVRVNDRGPFVDGRLIDLSREAAKQLGLMGQGVARVEVETIRLAPGETMLASARSAPRMAPATPLPATAPIAPPVTRGAFVVQVGSFQYADQALALKTALAAKYSSVRVRSFSLAGVNYYRVQVGHYQTQDQARQELGRIKQTGFPDAFVVALEED